MKEKIRSESCVTKGIRGIYWPGILFIKKASISNPFVNTSKQFTIRFPYFEVALLSLSVCSGRMFMLLFISLTLNDHVYDLRTVVRRLRG